MERRATDEAFARDWEEALDMGTDTLEDRATTRAFVGWEEPVFNHGKQVGTRKVYDSVLTIAILNARRPEKFKRTARADAASTGAASTGAKGDADARRRVAEKLATLANRGRVKPPGA